MSFPYEIIERPFNQLLREPPFREGQTMGGREEVLRCSEHHGSRSALLGTHGACTSQISPGKITFLIACVCLSACVRTSFFTVALLISSVMLTPELCFSFLHMKHEEPEGLSEMRTV